MTGGLFSNAYRGKRVLVTGHTGFKGSWLSHWLTRLGAEVAGYSLYLPSEPSNFVVLGLDRRMKDVRGDIRDFAQLQAAFDQFRPEIVFHMAAQPIVMASYDDPKRTFDTNLGGTVNVLEVLRASLSLRAAVFITSDKCYENIERDYGYREADRLGGKDPYSASKACAEVAISAYCRSFFGDGQKRVASTRAGNVIGGGDWAADRIVPDCMRAWSRGLAVPIRSPRATRPWQHVLEPLSGYLQLGARLLDGEEGIGGEAFNFGPRDDVNEPVSRLIDTMSQVWTGMSWEKQRGEEGKPEAGLLKLNCDKALQRLSWHACLSFEEAVHMTAEWYRAYYAGSIDMKTFTDTQINAYCDLSSARGLAWARA